MTHMIPLRTLRDDKKIPALGFGTYPLRGFAGVNVVSSAIKSGYRLLDSAVSYDNEGAVGKALAQSGLPRDQFFVTSKLPGKRHKPEAVLPTVEETLMRMGLDYLDLYLIHWPNPRIGLYVEAWQGLIEAKKKGLVRSIGVCNFLPEHLNRLIKETEEIPVVNQVELHPYFSQKDLREFHRKYHITTQCWSPLGRGSDLLENPVIISLAQRYGKSVTQIILRWHIQNDVLPLPKSSNPQRQIENLSIFDFSLNNEDMAAIDSLTQPKGRIKGLDPASHEDV